MSTPNREKALALYTEHPTWVFARIAAELGISRERVRQLLSKEKGLYSIGTAKNPLHYQTYGLLCPECGGLKEKKSKKCQVCNATLVVDLVCTYCGKSFERRAALQAIQDKRLPNHGENTFCGNSCQGKWAAANFGFGAHPESAGAKSKGKRQAFCKRGHAMTGDNVYVVPSTGAWQCRACGALRRKAHSQVKTRSSGPIRAEPR